MKCSLCPKEIESHQGEIALDGYSSVNSKVNMELKICHSCFSNVLEFIRNLSKKEI